MDWFKIIKQPLLMQIKEKEFIKARKEIERMNITYDISQKYINRIKAMK